MRLATNVDTLCYDAVGVSSVDLKGVEWLNGVGRAARDGCVVLGMQKTDEVVSIRRLMEDPGCLWLQIDVSGGGWASDDAPVVVDDGYMAAGAADELVAGGGGVVPPPCPPQVALPMSEVARELGLRGFDDDDSVSDVDMESSPLVARAARRLGTPGGDSVRPEVGPVVLFPAVPVLPAAGGRPLQEGTVPDSVDGGTRIPTLTLARIPSIGMTLLMEEAAGLAGVNALVERSWGT